VTVTAAGGYASCRVCGTALTHDVEFAGERYTFPDDPRKRYCSQRCKQAAYRAHLSWKDQFHGLPDGFTARERNRARRNRSKRSKFDYAWCVGCERDMPRHLRADARYCSPACRQRAYRNRKAAT
jgi:hypothetical protein